MDRANMVTPRRNIIFNTKRVLASVLRADTWLTVSDMKKKLFVLDAGILNEVSKKEAKKIGLIKMINSL